MNNNPLNLDMTKPLSPKEVADSKISAIHPQMIVAVNQLLIEKYESGTIEIKQSVIIDRFLELVNEVGWTRDRVFDTNQLDFEEVFRKAGWKVEYDKPAFNESGEAYFKFTPKTKP